MLLKNENEMAGMVDIMTHLHDYVPKINSPGNPEKLLPIPFCGDQLTCSRARSSQNLRRTSDSPSEGLTGLIAYPADWHAKMNMYEVRASSGCVKSYLVLMC